MIDLLPVSIGIGLVVSLLFSELFGLAAGGMVVPGYIALSLDEPIHIVVTLGAALVTFAIVHSLSTIVIIYGKRRTVLMILVGYLIGIILGSIPLASLQGIQGLENISASDLSVIGYIIPGLIAIWIDRQGLVETLAVLLTAAVVIRLILILLLGTELVG